MASNGAATKTAFTATIGRQNDTGFQIQERPGKWLNFSKFGDRPIVPPEGTVARVTIDARDFVVAIEPLDEAPPAQLPLDRDPSAAVPVASRIARLALIKAAARFHADRPDATVDDVLGTARHWEEWVNRVD